MPAKILYVEDNPGEVFLLQEAVRTLNANVQLVTAGDGEVALNLLLSASLQPSVIVLDLNLPHDKNTRKLHSFLYPSRPVAIVLLLPSPPFSTQ